MNQPEPQKSQKWKQTQLSQYLQPSTSNSAEGVLNGGNPVSLPEEVDGPVKKDSNTEKTWSGIPLVELPAAPPLSLHAPALIPSRNHTIHFQVPWKTGEGIPLPHPKKYEDLWDAVHVRLPCSPKNLYPVQKSGGEREVVGRWELIRRALKPSGREIQDSHDLETAIMEYNSIYANKWDFSTLHHFFNDILEEDESLAFFKEILPKLIDLALDLENIVTRAPLLLKQGENHALSLSQVQVACLLANAFLCTYPRRNALRRDSEYSSYPDINFNRYVSKQLGNASSCSLYVLDTMVLDLFGGRGSERQRKVEKLKCIMSYFQRVTSSSGVISLMFTLVPEGVVTYMRRRVPSKCFPIWLESKTYLRSRIHIDSEGLIEVQGHGLIQIDFANKYGLTIIIQGVLYVGGGVLGGGLVQEEIRFLLSPELILSRLFTEQLDDNEVLVCTGVEQWNYASGYASEFQWVGRCLDETQHDDCGRRMTQVIAMDALHFTHLHTQFKPSLICRELNKAYAGFFNGNHKKEAVAVATGNWGCGAFGGDPKLKFLIQLMAATEASRDLAYFTFHDSQLRDDLFLMHSFLVKHDVTVGDLCRELFEFYKQDLPPDQLYPSLYSHQWHRCHEVEGGMEENQSSCEKL
ncbi:unnamed protein product [Darwinula stevensoni]|uniref:poly(ADP-ribose) glycohydrolase n=1 Tax=Darwinula stevensoni TaxID=69355 RepID=A0A7R9A340_9CRUS|nr:unnamed protein product [Darwinula stevensoni]CAG0889946.1 unnamed protein product [Darwinula stevensoni]